MGGSVGVRRHDEEVDSECMLVVIRLGTLAVATPVHDVVAADHLRLGR